MKRLVTLNELPINCRICIYGSGNSADMLLRLLREIRTDVKIVCLVDTITSGKKYDIDIVNIKDIDSLKGNYDLILIASDFHREIEETLNALSIDNYKIVVIATLGKMRQHWLSDKSERPCHYRELFINHDGYLFPCCLARTDEQLRIAHITDDDVFELIRHYSGACNCERAKLRKATPKDSLKGGLLNFELALTCNSRCAMCIVNAPAWSGTYDYYSLLNRIIEHYAPKEVKLQGGEVPRQKRSMEWVNEAYQRYPDVTFSLITNSNYDLDMVDTIDRLFKKVFVSTIVGFQPETYRKITGLDLNKTLRFAQEIVDRKRSKDTTIWPRSTLAYLTTPIGFHEVNLFLRWAIALRPDKIHIYDSDLQQYINRNTSDDFWKKIFATTAKTFKTDLLALKPTLMEGNTVIWITKNNMDLLEIDAEFLVNNALDKKVLLSSEAYERHFRETFA
ncbi:MAG: hypothetical protein HQL03_01995 [Nitrospirae bacterium]|nr:hypothetical protein [Nitrospirota bacterium]MBF0591288.1 hypothetical protein [Nitrospirota bacterium]